MRLRASLEKVVEKLIPREQREQVLGDLAERYVSPFRYIRDAIKTIPFVTASHVRRSLGLRGDMHAKAWRLNALWLAFGCFILVMNPKEQRGLGSGINGLIILAICYLAWRNYRRGLSDIPHQHAALSILRDPRRNEIERKRDGLLQWADPGAVSYTIFAAPIIFILYLIAFPLVIVIGAWFGGSLPSDVSMLRLWTSSIGFVVLLVSWIFLRRFNKRAANALQRELDVLDASEGQQ
jgi:hypothetical protein